MSRRIFFKLTGKVFLFFQFFFLTGKVQARKTEKNLNFIDERDTLARAMQYCHDAGKASVARTNKGAFCYNCSKYNLCMDGDTNCKPLKTRVLKRSKGAPCQIFKAKYVAKKGWCLSWNVKS